MAIAWQPTSQDPWAERCIEERWHQSCWDDHWVGQRSCRYGGRRLLRIHQCSLWTRVSCRDQINISRHDSKKVMCKIDRNGISFFRPLKGQRSSSKLKPPPSYQADVIGILPSLVCWETTFQRTVLLHNLKELDDDLWAWSNHALTLAGLLGVVHGLEGIVKDWSSNHFGGWLIVRFSSLERRTWGICLKNYMLVFRASSVKSAQQRVLQLVSQRMTVSRDRWNVTINSPSRLLILGQLKIAALSTYLFWCL